MADAGRDPNPALVRAVDAAGSQAKLAKLLGVAQPSVWRWVRCGKALPAEHVLKVEQAYGISRHDLRPDLYPRTASTDVASAQFEHAR